MGMTEGVPNGMPNSRGLSELVTQIGHDLRAIAHNEVELGRGALAARVQSIVADMGMVLLGAVVAVVGIALLCLTAVPALGAVIPALWARMLIMSLVYLGLGIAAVWIAGRRIRHGRTKYAELELGHQVDEARDTFRAIGRGLSQ